MTAIKQSPLFSTMPVGQNVIFSVSNASVVSNFVKIKIIAEVYIDTAPIVITSTSLPVGTFKTTPNNAGVGMFDFRPIIESYVSSDHLAVKQSQYKGMTANDNPFPIDLVDKYSKNNNVVRYMRVRFKTEYLDTATNTIIEDGTQATSLQYNIFNGYIKHTDDISIAFNSNFGFNTDPFQISSSNGTRFLTNAPLVQYANDIDYGTIAYLSEIFEDDGGTNDLNHFKISYFKNDGTTSYEDIPRNWTNGAYSYTAANSTSRIIYFGCFPANLRNWSSAGKALIEGGTLDYYQVQGYNAAGNAITDKPIISMRCPTLKGFEPIRLKWLNQWGVWDYYTFNMKSTKSISTKGSTYQQLEGTWNESTYAVNGYKGGKKSFRVNATEKITMNTDFVNEEESVWFEELINSPEVYILEGYQTDATTAFVYSSLNKYVTPTRLITSSYTRKTVANDKLMQYTFEVEKSKTLRTQAI